MSSADANGFGPARLLSTLVPAIACTVAILCGACARNTTAPGGARVRGAIALVMRVTDVDGAVVDSLTEASDSGVMVRALTRAGLGDSATSVSGSFSVPAGFDSTWLVVGPSVATSDTLGPWFVRPGGVTGLALRLHDKGTMVMVNTLGAGAPMSATFSVFQAERMILRVRNLDGRTVRTLYDGTLAAGVHRAAWDRNDDAGAPVPAGSYWVTCELGPVSGGVPRADIGPAPGPPINDSGGSRALVRLVR